MLYLLLEFGEITMDGLVESGAFINAMSWSDYNAIKMNSDSCVIKEYPQPPFKIECANAQLEQPIATADIQFNIGTYLHGHLRHPIENVISHHRIELHEKSPSSNRHCQRDH